MVGQIFGAAMSGIQAAASKNDSFKNQNYFMGQQFKYNEQAANNNLQRAKNLWSFTNFTNQMKEIKKAGLSPGLIYGQSGAGGSTQGAGANAGVSQPQDRSVELGLKGQELGLQLANIASQTRLNESQAQKNEAEAEKVKGADTKAQEATIDNLVAQTSNEKIKRGLILSETRVNDAEEELKRAAVDWTKEKTNETKWSIKMFMKGLDELEQKIDGLTLDNELKRRTIDNKVKESVLTLQNLFEDILLKGSQRKVNEEQAKAIVEQVKQGWTDLTRKGKELILDREKLNVYAQDVVNRLNLGEKGLDIEEQKLLKDVVLGILDIAAKSAGIATGAKVNKTGFQ